MKFGICQIWTQDTLRNFRGLLMVIFVNMSIYDDPRLFEYFKGVIIEWVCQEWVTHFQVGRAFSAHIYVICKI